MIDTHEHWRKLIGSWGRSLRSSGKSPRTIAIYTRAAEMLGLWLAKEHPSVGPADIRKAHLEEFLVAFREGVQLPGMASRRSERSGAYVNQTYRALQRWCAWLVAEEELDRDPTLTMEAPAVPEALVPVLSDEQLKALLKVCVGKRLPDRRDTAIIRLLVDSGPRIGELAGLRVTDVDLDKQVAVVDGKTGPRVIAFGARTADALDRYLRIRAADRWGRSEHLWLGERNKGPLSANGIYLALRRRGKQAGVEGLHPHMFRHTFASRWLANGGQEGDLMHLAGWQSTQMVRRYGAAAAAERARDAHRRMGLADDL